MAVIKTLNENTTHSKLESKIAQSMKYNDLDYKWAVRKYIMEHPEASQHYRAMASSSFAYYEKYKDTLEQDPSIQAILTLCTDGELQFDTNIHDPDLFYLSNSFNHIVLSDRKLHKCYDCGTNARAMFMKLIQVHRGLAYLSQSEQERMKLDYRVSYERCVEKVQKCWDQIVSIQQDCIFIMSIGIDEFGHVWVIEKRYFDGKPRYHHYQSSFRSHLVLDFIERKDYGRSPDQSLDIDEFFENLMYIMSTKTPWTEEEYVLFCEMFAFHPVSPVKNPKPGFCYTYVVY